MTVLLVDADIVAYRASYAAQDNYLWKAKEIADDIMVSIAYECMYPEDCATGFNTFLYLTGGGNFRYELATIKPYKGHRGEKPKHLAGVREHLEDKWNAEVITGEEADDAIAKKATELKGNCIIASIDKDFLQVPSTFYNFTKKEWTDVSETMGNRFFYIQLLTGDTADNIQGVKGIGPKKAEKIYEGCTSELDYYRKALEAYKGDLDALVENARLLWLRRYDEQMWEPPE